MFGSHNMGSIPGCMRTVVAGFQLDGGIVPRNTFHATLRHGLCYSSISASPPHTKGSALQRDQPRALAEEDKTDTGRCIERSHFGIVALASMS